jgi:orotidine-5'-phosphate decarboxylase
VKEVRERLIIALDFSDWEEALSVVEALPQAEFYKVGLELYLASRGEAVQHLRKMGKKVFLDLKFHDIPNTVKQASRQAVLQGAAMFNYHASGGSNMMRQGMETARQCALEHGLPLPLIIAVTVLTSINEDDLTGIGLRDTPGKIVTRWAKLAQDAGLDGVVASPWEIELIREACGPDFKIVCPGVRPSWWVSNDQKRYLTPGEAIARGADYLVIGRPVTRSPRPGEAIQMVYQEIKEGLQARALNKEQRGGLC